MYGVFRSSPAPFFVFPLITPNAPGKSKTDFFHVHVKKGVMDEMRYSSKTRQEGWRYRSMGRL
jgi:hypothetical protein